MSQDQERTEEIPGSPRNKRRERDLIRRRSKEACELQRGEFGLSVKKRIEKRTLEFGLTEH